MPPSRPNCPRLAFDPLRIGVFAVRTGPSADVSFDMPVLSAWPKALLTPAIALPMLLKIFFGAAPLCPR